MTLMCGRARKSPRHSASMPRSMPTSGSTAANRSPEWSTLSTEGIDRTGEARRMVRAAMPVEADLAFRRRCETVIEYLEAGPDDTILDCGCGYGFYLRLLDDLTGAGHRRPRPGSGCGSTQCRPSTRRSIRGFHLIRGDAQDLPFAADVLFARRSAPRSSSTSTTTAPPWPSSSGCCVPGAHSP